MGPACYAGFPTRNVPSELSPAGNVYNLRSLWDSAIWYGHRASFGRGYCQALERQSSDRRKTISAVMLWLAVVYCAAAAPRDGNSIPRSSFAWREARRRSGRSGFSAPDGRRSSRMSPPSRRSCPFRPSSRRGEPKLSRARAARFRPAEWALPAETPALAQPAPSLGGKLLNLLRQLIDFIRQNLRGGTTGGGA